ncbi:MAG: DUF6328 family protein [Gaiellaceae bacterium]
MPAGDDERLDRELIELLNELRVALPGVQVLFAFLLAVPFTQQFERLGEFQKDTYFVTLLSTAASSILLIAPSSYHRLRWREHDKERLLRVSNALAIAGLALLAAAMTGAVFLITNVLFDRTWASVTGTLLAGGFALFWYGLPFAGKLRDRVRG